MIEELKQKYNELIKRRDNAVKYFQNIEDQELLNKELKRLYPKYDEVVNRLHKIREQIECFGYNLTNKEIVEGFELNG